MRDGISRFTLKRVLSPQASAGDDTAWVGEIIDHQGYDRAMYGILTGAIPDADATFVVLLQEGDASNLSDATAVADEDMVSQTLGTAPEVAAAFRFDDDNEVRKLAYIGSKRYTRLTITPATNTGATLYGAFCVLSDPSTDKAMVAQPAA